jgi:hypothetical protein
VERRIEDDRTAPRHFDGFGGWRTVVGVDEELELGGVGGVGSNRCFGEGTSDGRGGVEESTGWDGRDVDGFVERGCEFEGLGGSNGGGGWGWRSVCERR